MQILLIMLIVVLLAFSVLLLALAKQSPREKQTEDKEQEEYIRDYAETVRQTGGSMKKLEHWKVIAIYLIIYDMIAVNFSYFMALLVRFDFRYSSIPTDYFDAWRSFAPIYTIIILAVFGCLHLYNSVWRFASFHELIKITVATVITGVLHIVGITIFWGRMPASYYLIGIMLQFFLTVGVRFSYRFVLLERNRREKIWKCNDKITEQNFNRLENMDLYHLLTPAVLSYEGIAFQYMAPSVFEDSQFEYVQNHLRIISAFYGVLKPRDGVTPYRLEMQAKVGIGETKNLYEYWGDLLYRSVIDNSRIIINLASKEYSKCIEKYLTRQDRYITITFCELSGDKLVTKGTYAKMARGEMVRFMAENRIENPEDIKKFDRLGYSFRSDLSSDAEYVFERKK